MHAQGADPAPKGAWHHRDGAKTHFNALKCGGSPMARFSLNKKCKEPAHHLA
jgi:hypothetical protein